MNTLEFEVNNQILKRIDSQTVVNKNKNIYKCRFTFDEDSEWIDLNKFIIFRDGWGNSSTVHLGKQGSVLSCIIPEKVLRGSYFKVSVYAGDLISTNTVSIALVQSGYLRRGHYHDGHPYGWNHHNCHPHFHDDQDVFVQIFDRLDNTVDSIVYDNHTLHLFCDDSLLESIYLPFILEDEFEGLVEDLFNRFIGDTDLSVASQESDGLLSKEDKIKLDNIEEGANRTIVDDSLNEDSDNPISNKTVTQALSGKEDSYDMVERLDNIIVNLINNNGE